MKQLLIVLFAIILFTGCNNNKGWSSAEKQKGLKLCLDEVEGKLGDKDSKKFCSCLLEKAERKYPNYAVADKAITDEEGQTMGKACVKEIGLQVGGAGDEDENGGLGGKKKKGGLLDDGGEGGGDITGDDEGGGGGWSAGDKRKYMNECLPSAGNNGMDEESASTYCDCTLKKLQKKYKSYTAAQNNLTTEELATLQKGCMQQ